MYLGRYEHSLDEKHRVAVPARLRAELGPGAVLTRGFDNCLCIYPASRWEALSRAIDDLPQARYEARSLARAVFSSAVPCEFDRQGRVAVPTFLREYAGITTEVVIAGVNSHVEMWSREAWLAEQDQIETIGANIADVLVGTASHVSI